MGTTTSCKSHNKKRTCLHSYRKRARALGYSAERKTERKRGRKRETDCVRGEKAGSVDKGKVKERESVREMKERRGEWIEARSLLLQSEKKGKGVEEREKSCLRNSIQPFLSSRGNFLENPSLEAALGEGTPEQECFEGHFTHRSWKKHFYLLACFWCLTMLHVLNTR